MYIDYDSDYNESEDEHFEPCWPSNYEFDDDDSSLEESIIHGDFHDDQNFDFGIDEEFTYSSPDSDDFPD